MNSPSVRFPFLAATLLAAFSNLSAQTVNWDGTTASDVSGLWSLGTNWAGDAAPSTTAIVAGLINVTSGTRTVTIASGETITAKSLLFTQTTAGASNVVNIAAGGLLNLGGGQTWAAPTAGTNRVDLGGTVDFTGLTSGNVTVNTALTFTNTGAVFRSSNTSGAPVFNFNGVVNVNAGSGGTASIAYTGGNRAISATFGSTSSLLINSGTLEVATTLYNNSPAVTVALQGVTTIVSGSGLSLIADSANNVSTGSASVALTNSGTLSQSGTITTSSRGAAGSATLTNSSVWKVSGLTAAIEKTNRATALNPTIVNSTGASFTGATASDKIDFNHLQTPGTDIAFANSGTIAAGNGSGLTALTSVGTLTLVDFAITNASGSFMAFDVGGSGAGEFDVIALQSSSLVFTNSTLAITLVNGFTPGAGFSVNLFTSDVPASVSGSFASITVNGVADANYSFAYNSTTGIGTLSYVSAVPEPSTYALVAGALALGAVVVRRRLRKVVA